MSSASRGQITDGTPPLPTGPLPRANSSVKIFRPTDIQNCILWLDATDPANTGVQPSAGTLATWVDRSGSGNSTTTSAGTPQWSPIGANQKPAVTFNGTTGMFAIPLVVSQDWSVFIVLATTQTNTGTGGQWWDGAGIFDAEVGGTAADFGMSLYGSKFAFGLGNPPTGDNTILSTSNINTGAFFICEGFRTQSSGAFTLSINGAQQASGTGGTGTRTTSRITLGSIQTGANYFSGSISEIVCYTRVLTNAEQQSVEGYLAWKWGNQSSLATTHSYYNYPVYELPPFPLFLTVISRKGQNAKWIPSQLGTLCVWFDASDKYYMTFSGASMTQWTDKSSSALTTSYTGTAPTLAYTNTTTGVPGAITYTSAKTYPGLYFNGATSGTTLRTSSLPTTGLTGTTWITLATNLTAPASITDASLVIASEQTSSSPWSSNTEKSIRFDPPGAAFLYTFNGGTNGANSNIFRQDNTSIMNTNGIRGFIDTAAYFTTFQNGLMNLSNTNAVTFSPSSNNTLRMGSWSSGFLNGYIFEILIFNTALSLIQYQQAEGYLAWKWGLQGALPSSHPYRLFPPSP